MDRFTSEIIKDALVATGDEMFSALARTAMSTIIYETLDFAVGLTDAKGELLTQGDGVTLFLATLDTTVQEILTRYGVKGDIHDGDVFIANDPYGGGGTHLSDVSIVLPVFFRRGTGGIHREQGALDGGGRRLSRQRIGQCHGSVSGRFAVSLCEINRAGAGEPGHD